MPVVAAGQFTIVDVNDGVTSSLSNESAVLAASSTGTVASYAGAETQFKVIEGGADTTSAWTYYVSGTGGGISYRDSDDAADRTGTGMAAGALGGTNLVSYSEYNATTWTLTWSGPTVSTGISDPLGGTDAVRISMQSWHSSGLQVTFPSVTANGTSSYVVSFWCRLVSGSGSFSATLQGISLGSYAAQLATGAWTRVTLPTTPSAGGKTYLELIAFIYATATLDFFGVQLEPGSTASALTRTSGAVASGTRGYVRVTALSQDLSYLDITAVKVPGTTLTRRFSVAKARQGVRGTITTSRAITGTTWSDSEANSAIVDAGGISPLQGDVVTLYNSASGFSQTRVYTAAGAWSALAGFFGGDVLVNGTLTAQKIVAEGITKTASTTGPPFYGAVGTTHDLLRNGSNVATPLSFVCTADAKRTILINVEFSDETAFGTAQSPSDPVNFQGFLGLKIAGSAVSASVDSFCQNGTTTTITWIYLDSISRSGAVNFQITGRADNFGGGTRTISGFRDPTITILEHIR
jgi:hypothetical protein